METIRARDGVLIAYERSGQGFPLIVVHGTTADHTRWALVLPVFEQHFTVYAIDRRGRGEVGMPNRMPSSRSLKTCWR